MRRTISFWLCLVISALLFIGGFFVPPLGVIDGSLLQAAGILLGFSVVGQLPEMMRIMKNAGSARFSKGDMTIEFSKDRLEESRAYGRECSKEYEECE